MTSRKVGRSISRVVLVAVVVTILLLLPLSSYAQQDVRAVHALTVRRSLHLCARAWSIHPNTWVKGYFQRGPITDGPLQFEGVMSESRTTELPMGTVPSTPAQREGLHIGVGYDVRLTREQYAVLRRIHPGSFILAHGTVACLRRSALLNADMVRLVLG